MEFDISGGAMLGFIASVICFLIPALLTLPIGLILSISSFVKVSKKRKELPTLERRVDELKDELTKYFEKYGYCVIGIEMSNPRIVRAIYDIIRQGIADSPKEAVNSLLSSARASDHEMEMARRYDTFYPARFFVDDISQRLGI